MRLYFRFLPFEYERSEMQDFYYPRYYTKEVRDKYPNQKFPWETLEKL